MKIRHLGLLMIAALLMTDFSVAFAVDWSEPVAVMRRRQGTVISYRAKVEAGYLVVEATHGKGWHTYSMDNLQRAKQKTGKEKPDTEQSTRIEISGGLTIAGKWLQSTPKDLSMVDIEWYTWGFEDVTYFAVPVKKSGDEAATITFFAQACNSNSCSMVDGQSITIEADAIPDVSPADEPPLPANSYVTVGDPEGFGEL